MGEEVLPVLRKELSNIRDPRAVRTPNHADMVKAKYQDKEPRQPKPNANRGDNVTGTSSYVDSDATIKVDLPRL